MHILFLLFFNNYPIPDSRPIDDTDEERVIVVIDCDTDLDCQIKNPGIDLDY